MRIKAVLPNMRTLEIREADGDDVRLVRVRKLIVYEHSIGGVSLFFYDSSFDVSPVETLEFDTRDEATAWVTSQLGLDQDGWYPIPDPLPRTFYTRERPMRSAWTPRGRKITLPDEEVSESPFHDAMLEMERLLTTLNHDILEQLVPLIEQEQFGKAEVVVQQAMGISWSEAKCVIETLIPRVIGRDQLRLD